MTETILSLVDEMIDSFDFEKVYRVMKHVDWKYAKPDGTVSLPEIIDLKRTARSCLRNAYRFSLKYGDDASVVGSGGFEAQYFPAKEKEGPMFRLRFILSEGEVVAP
jgi:hypothetical protein